MEIFFQLEKILKRHDLEKQVTAVQLATYLDVHRQTVAKLLSGEARVINLDVVSRLCRWLLDQGVPQEELPAGLFGMVPSELWKAVAGKQRTSLCLGQYHEMLEDPVGPARLWISRRDADVANAILKRLYPLRGAAGASTLGFSYIPFRFRTTPDGRRQRFLTEDAPAAKRVFREMQEQKADTASILLGSAEVNYLVEIFMANLWGIRPFQRSDEKRRAPVYVLFRHSWSGMTSCFGGLEPPPGLEGKGEPGIYYLGPRGQWNLCPWKPDKEDAALVILVNDPAASAIDLVLAGYTGRATAAMEECFVGETKPFWPPYCQIDGRQIGVYICRLLVDGHKSQDPEPYRVRKFQVIRLDEAVIKRHFRK